MMHPLSRLATLPFRWTPASFRRRLVQVVTRAAAAGPPAAVHVKHRLMRYHDLLSSAFGPANVCSISAADMEQLRTPWPPERERRSRALIWTANVASASP